MRKRRNRGNIPILRDRIYQKDKEDEEDLERRYMELELSPKQRMIINDYIACIKSAESRCLYLYLTSLLRGRSVYDRA